MAEAEYQSTTIKVTAGDFELRVRGRILEFDGFTRVMPSTAKKDADEQLPDLRVGDELKSNEVEPLQHFTKPVPRFGEASLVRELEKLGIGRPSTYASIISTIQDRGYVRLENKRFYAEKIGELVTDRLSENFTNLMNYDFTANMEANLDNVASGETSWTGVLDSF